MARADIEVNVVIRSLHTVIKSIMEVYAAESAAYSFDQDAKLLLDADSKAAEDQMKLLTEHFDVNASNLPDGLYNQ